MSRFKRDGRNTRVGKVLRATGLDEIPQFINILSGEMSAVGPRPLTDGDVRRLGWTGSAFICGQRLRQVARAATSGRVKVGTRRVIWKTVRLVR